MAMTGTVGGGCFLRRRIFGSLEVDVADADADEDADVDIDGEVDGDAAGGVGVEEGAEDESDTD